MSEGSTATATMETKTDSNSIDMSDISDNNRELQTVNNDGDEEIRNKDGADGISDEPTDNNAVNGAEQDCDIVKEETSSSVTCPYCDHQFEVFDRDVIGMHLTIVHFVTNSLDDLLEFTVSKIEGPKILKGVPEEDRLECISPEPLATIKPLPEPEDLSDIESEDEPEKEPSKAEDDGVKDGTVNEDKQEEDETTKEEVSKSVEADAVSDLSLSDEEAAKSQAEMIVLDETKEEENVDEEKTTTTKATTTAATATSSGHCTKCDVRHQVGTRCSYVLKSSSADTSNSRKSPHHDSRHKRVRTLPPELYHNPDNIDNGRRRSHRSRSPVAPPRRVAPPPPSPGYGDRRDRRDRSPGYGDSRDSYGDRDRRDRGCMLCGESSHSVKDCPELFCHKCKARGHFAKECTAQVVTQGYSTASGQYNPFSQVPANMTNYPAAYSTPNPAPAPTDHSTPYTPAPNTNTPYTHQVTDHLPTNYTESLYSLQPLQAYMSAKMVAMPGQPYPRNYIDLLISNVGKMLAQANLGLRELYSAYMIKGDAFIRNLLNKELQVYADKFPGGVNLPLIIQSTVEFLVSQQFNVGDMLQ